MTRSKTVLVTGGAGYIGSHTCVELIEAGYEVVVMDNLSNSHAESLNRIERITGKRPVLHRLDMRDPAALQPVFDAHPIAAVLHFAGLKAVGESVQKPLLYYDNNIAGTVHLLETMRAVGCRTMVFSSSATVYGDQKTMPIRENAPTGATNPYGRSKLFIEAILRDVAGSEPGWRMALLRYFNPVGAHASGLIGEDPQGIPNNLLPYVAQVAIGKLPELTVFGNDYPTPDGTGVRDYIHVVDLAKGHVAALAALEKSPGVLCVNLGTGRGYSVLDMVRAFEAASGKKIPYRIAARRTGDIATCYADPTLAAETLDWRATLDINHMCRDTWRWQQSNPQGYRS
jgi:UDP-glucose 4-epimerase